MAYFYKFNSRVLLQLFITSMICLYAHVQSLALWTWLHHFCEINILLICIHFSVEGMWLTLSENSAMQNATL